MSDMYCYPMTSELVALGYNDQFEVDGIRYVPDPDDDCYQPMFRLMEDYIEEIFDGAFYHRPRPMCETCWLIDEDIYRSQYSACFERGHAPFNHDSVRWI